MTPKTLVKRPGFSVTAVGPIMIGTFHGDVSVAEIALMEGAYQEMIKAHPKFSFLAIIPRSSTKSMTNELKDAAGAVTARYEQYMVGSATALIVSGVAAMVIRTFLLGMNMVSKSKTPNKVFTKTDEAVAWLLSLPGLTNPPGAEALERIAADLADPSKLAA